jgi:hypothetical protein
MRARTPRSGAGTPRTPGEDARCYSLVGTGVGDRDQGDAEVNASQHHGRSRCVDDQTGRTHVDDRVRERLDHGLQGIVGASRRPDRSARSR